MIFSDPSVQLVLESMMDAFIAYDSEWRFLYVNKEAEALMGYSRSDVLGKVLWEYFPETVGSEFEQRFRRVAETGDSADFETYDTQSKRWLNLRAFQYPTGHIGVFWNDITVQKNIELELRKSNDRWNLAVEGAEVGIWDWDLRTDEVFYSSRWRAQLGYDHDEIASNVSAWHEKIHPDYLTRALSAIDDHVKGLSDRLMLDYRMKHKNGSYRWIHCRGKALRSTLDVPVRIAGSHEDVTEIREAHLELAIINNELETARDQALSASLVKSAFLANMSHEIRTPLNGVLATASLLMEKQLGPGIQEYVEMISHSGRTLMRVIDDILDMSKVEAGQMHLEAVPERLQFIIEETMDLYRAQAEKRGLTLKAIYNEPLPVGVLIDGIRLRQVLGNLVSNGIKFTQEGGVQIEVTATSLANNNWRLDLMVSDTGLGIAPEQIERIFEPFVQADIDTFRRFGGTGLGLAISKRIVDLMRGEITVASVVGMGSTFSLHFDCPESEIAEPDTATSSTTNAAGIKVLLAEDNEVNAIVTIHTLESLECLVVHTWNGQEAVDEARNTEFDLILLDVHMPVYSGIEVSEMIRSSSKNKQTIIGALTASASHEEATRCLQAGMNFVLTKPVTFSQIRSKLLEHFPSLIDQK